MANLLRKNAVGVAVACCFSLLAFTTGCGTPPSGGVGLPADFDGVVADGDTLQLADIDVEQADIATEDVSDVTAVDDAAPDDTAASDVDGAAIGTDTVAGDAEDATTPPSLPFPPCVTSEDCPGGSCVPGLQVCVPCLQNSQCGAGKICSELSCVLTTSCVSDVQCKATGQVCDQAEGKCVSCLADADCGALEQCVDQQCVPAKPCASSKECDGVCDQGKGVCVDCVSAADCLEGGACLAGKCVGPVCTANTCVGAWRMVCGKAGSGYLVQNCNDGQFCNGTESCVEGACQAGSPPSCNDGNACTVGDSCVEPACLAGTPTECDDANPCTSDSCDPSTGKCVFLAAAVPCVDGDACTVNDNCVDGVCLGGEVTPCADDGNACTLEGCNPATGECVSLASDGPCVDGNLCTVQDTCVQGVCAPGKSVVCDDANPCTKDACTPAVGVCVYTPITGPCDDGNLCTQAEACADGKCAGVLKACDDQNPCTIDFCDVQTGKCTSIGATGGCDDGDPCTTIDSCSGGTCKGGAPKDCDDGEPCTTDACSAGNCQHAPATGPCVDSNPCTTVDFCKGGKCVGAGNVCPCTQENAGTICNDNNPCTTDGCIVATSACQNTALDGVTCSDGDGCTGLDVCLSGTCTGLQPKDCNDANNCTDDSCDPLTAACKNSPNVNSCTDGNACTQGDACKDGICKGGSTQSCDDGIPCTLDTCTSGGACAHSAAPDGTSCEDGNPCTEAACIAGTCKGFAHAGQCGDSGCGFCQPGGCVVNKEPAPVVSLSQTGTVHISFTSSGGRLLRSVDNLLLATDAAGVALWSDSLQQSSSTTSVLAMSTRFGRAWVVQVTNTTVGNSNGGTTTQTSYALRHRAADAVSTWTSIGLGGAYSVFGLPNGAFLATANGKGLTIVTLDAAGVPTLNWSTPTPAGSAALDVTADALDGYWVLEGSSTAGHVGRISNAGVVQSKLALVPGQNAVVRALPAGGAVVVGKVGDQIQLTHVGFDGKLVAAMTVATTDKLVDVLALASNRILVATGVVSSTLHLVDVVGQTVTSVAAEGVPGLDSGIAALGRAPKGAVAVMRKASGDTAMVPLYAGGLRACDCLDSTACNTGAPCNVGLCGLGDCWQVSKPAGTACMENGLCTSTGTCQQPTCGNESCDKGEDWVTCPADCPAAGLGCFGKCGSSQGPVSHCAEPCSCAPTCAQQGNCCPDVWRYCPAP